MLREKHARLVRFYHLHHRLLRRCVIDNGRLWTHIYTQRWQAGPRWRHTAGGVWVFKYKVTLYSWTLCITIYYSKVFQNPVWSQSLMHLRSTCMHVLWIYQLVSVCPAFAFKEKLVLYGILTDDSQEYVNSKHVCPFSSLYLPVSYASSASITWFI